MKSSSYRNPCILVIDDEPDLCRIVKITLERLKGWEILIAESTQAGLAQAQMQQPDVILLDLTLLPNGDCKAIWLASAKFCTFENACCTTA